MLKLNYVPEVFKFSNVNKPSDLLEVIRAKTIAKERGENLSELVRLAGGMRTLVELYNEAGNLDDFDLIDLFFMNRYDASLAFVHEGEMYIGYFEI